MLPSEDVEIDIDFLEALTADEILITPIMDKLPEELKGVLEDLLFYYFVRGTSRGYAKSDQIFKDVLSGKL